MNHKLVLGVAALLTCFSLTAGAAVSNGTPAKLSTAEEVLGSFQDFTVGDTTVTADEQQLLFRRLLQQNPMIPANVLGEQTKSNLKTRATLRNEAQRLGIDRRKGVVAGVRMAQTNVIAEAMVADWLKDHPVSDKDVRDAYDKDKEAYGKNEYRLRNILVEDEDKAKSIIAEIKNKDDFAKFAKFSSLDSSTRTKGGLNDFIGYGQLSPELKKAVTNMKAGDMTKAPVKTPNGWQIIRVENVRAAQNFPAFDKVKDRYRASVTAEKVRKYAADLASKSVVR